MKFDGVNDTELLRSAVTNDTFTLSTAEDVIRNAVDTSYGHLLETQKNFIGLHRFNKTTEDLYKENGKVCMSLEKDFIEQFNRKAYRTSELFDKELTLDEINENRNIFVKIPLVFIDGLSTFSYKVKPSKDRTIIVFQDEEGLLMKAQHDFTVLFIFNNGYKGITTNKYIMQKYNNDLPNHFFGGSIYGEGEPNQIAFIQEHGSLIGSCMSNVSCGEESVNFDLSPYSSAVIKNSREVDINIVNIRYMHTLDGFYKVRRKYNGDAAPELFVIEHPDGGPYPMPIPVENILVLKYNPNRNDYIVDNNVTVTHHYPHIYEINDKYMTMDSLYKVVYFYYDTNDKTTYVNKIDSYLHLLYMNDNDAKTLEEALNTIYFSEPAKRGYLTLFDKYFNFTDFVYTYNHGDFFSSFRPHHFDYKIDKMNEFISAYPEHLREYVKKQNNIGESYCLFVKNIDLEERLRLDNHKDVTKESDQMTFDEPCYMFAFRNEGSSFLDLRIFIDGIQYTPKYFSHYKGMEYIYIPTRLITLESYIEIERFETFIFSQEITFKKFELGTEITVITDGAEVLPTTQDLYFVNTETGRYIGREKFEISVEINQRHYIVDPERYMFLNKFNIKLLDNSLADTPILIKINKRPKLYTKFMHKDGVFSVKLPNKIKRDKRYIRVFLNGRLVPYDYWVFRYSDDNERPVLSVRYRLKKGDVVTVDVTPYQYDLVYSTRMIRTSTVVDLKDIVDKPLDISYYDMYMNGRKLSECNVIHISPTKIKLINLESFHNFCVYQKDRDEEFFHLNYEDGSYITCEDELIDDDINIDASDENTIIDHIIDKTKPSEVVVTPNTNIEDNLLRPDDDYIFDVDLDMVTFFEQEFKAIRHLNPDIDQFRRSTIELYPEIYRCMKTDSRSEDGLPNVVHMNPDITPHAEYIIRINPSPESFDEELENLASKIMVGSLHLNPDKKQFNKDELEGEYPELLSAFLLTPDAANEPYVLPIDPDLTYGATNVIKINPQLDK